MNIPNARYLHDSIFGLFADDVLIDSVGIQQISHTITEKCALDGAFLGCFVFHPQFLKRGFGITAVWAGCYYVHKIANVGLVQCGVDLQNMKSVKILKSRDFTIKSETAENIYMHCTAEDLMSPLDISNIRIGDY